MGEVIHADFQRRRLLPSVEEVAESDHREAMAEALQRGAEAVRRAALPLIELPGDWSNHITHSFGCQTMRSRGSEMCLCNHDRLVQQLEILEGLGQVSDD